MKNMLNAEYVKIIITEINKSRKGAAMIMIFICLCCAAIDYILRKHGIVEDWYTQSYLIIGLFSACIWGVKTFNCIADKVETKQKKAKHIKTICNKYKFILDCMSKEEAFLIHNMVEIDSNHIKLPSTPHNLAMIEDFSKLGILESMSFLHNQYNATIYQDFITCIKDNQV